MTDRTVNNDGFTIERIFDFPVADVFRAYSDPVAKRSWFAEGEGWHVDSYDLDFRSGGSESSAFRFGDGPQSRYDAVIHDVVENGRIVSSYVMTIDGTRISASLATIEFLAHERGTRLIYSEMISILDGKDQLKDRKEGCAWLLEALAKKLGAMQNAA